MTTTAGPFPVMRFELEGMKHQLLLYLGKYHADIEAMVDESCQKVIETMDFDGIVRAQMEQAITEAIHRELKGFFSYGPGQKLIAAEMKRILWDRKGTAHDDQD